MLVDYFLVFVLFYYYKIVYCSRLAMIKNTVDFICLAVTLERVAFLQHFFVISHDLVVFFFLIVACIFLFCWHCCYCFSNEHPPIDISQPPYRSPWDMRTDIILDVMYFDYKTNVPFYVCLLLLAFRFHRRTTFPVKFLFFFLGVFVLRTNQQQQKWNKSVTIQKVQCSIKYLKSKVSFFTQLWLDIIIFL